ncbi:hypothetical protein HYR69_07710, partial [Candidatus Sumerlaeota bacterium]|nr:hypothetical protein [Candidatus Sumerlaeota bacterium]
HPTAVVASDAEVHPGAAIGPLAVVESRAVLGARVRIHALAYVGREEPRNLRNPAQSPSTTSVRIRIPLSDHPCSTISRG